MTHRCWSCKTEKPYSDFPRQPQKKKGISGECKACNNTRNKLYKAKNRTEVIRKKKLYRKQNAEKCSKQNRQYNLKRNYKLSPKDYDDLLAKQNHVCAICLKPETGTNQFGLKRLAVDHDHSTQKIRGLLCGFCNMGLGMFRDNSQSLLNAATYLEKNRDE